MFGRILTSKWLQFFVLFIALIAIARFAVSETRVTDTLRNYAFDQFNRWDPREPTDQVIIVDIDENSLRDIGQWPWPRDVIAEMVLNLSNMGAKVIAFDMVFAEPDRMSPKRFAEGLVNKGLINEDTQAQLAQLPDNDQVLSEAFRQAGNVVTGFTVARPEETRGFPASVKPLLLKRSDAESLKDQINKYDGLAINIDGILPHVAGNGSFIASPHSDGIIRKHSAIIVFEPKLFPGLDFFPTLGLEALRVAHNKKESIKIGSLKTSGNSPITEMLLGSQESRYAVRIGTSGLEVPIKSDGRIYLKFRDLDREKDYVSAADVIRKTENAAQKIQNKIVLIGTSAEGLRDIRNTAIQAFVPGVEVHFNFVEQVLQNNYLFRDETVSSQIEFFVILLSGLFIIILSLYLGVTSLVIAITTIVSVTGFGSFYLYTEHNLLFDPVNISLSIFIIFVTATLLNYLRSEISKKEIRGAFGLYISPEFMEELTDNPDKLTLGGEMRDLTVMFTDIRNFTTISESMTPEALINTMNDFLTPMSDVVMQTRGTIDKYMGDAMMAFWNAPLDDEYHAKHAVDAALTMKAALEPVNEQLRIEAEEKGVEPLQLAAGIGINTGPCAVGNMGSKQRFAYSALGDAVNLASRLEGQTKSYGLDLLVGEETINQIPDYATMDIDLIQVKGKTKPVQIFTVMGDEDFANTDDYKNFIAAHNAFLKAYRDGDFEKSDALLKDTQDYSMSENYSTYYVMMNERIQEHKKTPPKDWNGVFIATSK